MKFSVVHHSIFTYKSERRKCLFRGAMLRDAASQSVRHHKNNYSYVYLRALNAKCSVGNKQTFVVLDSIVSRGICV